MKIGELRDDRLDPEALIKPRRRAPTGPAPAGPPRVSWPAGPPIPRPKNMPAKPHRRPGTIRS